MLQLYERTFRLHDQEDHNKTMLILSKEILEELLDGVIPINNKTALVSITSPIETPPRIANYTELHTFRMRFQDQTRENEEDAPTAADFVGIKEFVDSMADVTVFMVQCGAGLSRSAAVAQAICDYLGWVDDTGKVPYFAEHGFFPNWLVYQLCRNALEERE